MVEAERALIAAKEGDLPTLRSLRRSAPFAADGFGATALHYAARTGQMDCVKWLVEAVGISSNIRGRSGATPLHDAAAQGQLDCVKYFLGNGAVDVETRDLSGHTALHLAARFGRFETVKWLIERANSNARAKSRNHMTSVHFSASGGHLTCLELLVFKAGYSSVNDVATDGTTPLYLAAQDGNLDCLKYLHSVGSKCDARARDGMLPIHGAAQNGHLDCLGYLLGIYTEHIATGTLHHPKLPLIESGQANLDERDATGATPAHYAASQGHVSVLKWLNAKGDISSIDKLGGSPLHDAAEQGQFECIRYLVENAELDVNQTDMEGLTPLALAVKSGHRRCIDYLKIATSKQAKAQKRQMKTEKQHAEEDSNNSTKTKITIQGKNDQASENVPAKNSSSAQRTSSDRKSSHPTVTNNNVNSRNAEKDGEVKMQARRFFSSFSVTNDSFVALGESPAQSAKQRAAANNNNNTDNSSTTSIFDNKNENHTSKDNNNNNSWATKHSNAFNNNSISSSHKKKRERPAQEIADVASSISLTASPNLQTAESSLHITQPLDSNVPVCPEPVKPLRERQLQPLPHFGDVIPPPLAFSENSDSSINKDENLRPQKQSAEMDEEDGSESTHLTGLFDPPRVNHKQVRFQQTDSLSVIVPIQSFEDKSDSQWQTSENGQDGGTKVVGPEVRSSQPMKEEPCNTSHVTGTGSGLRRVDQSASEEFPSDLPPWKRQILVNRKLKEKAQEKAEREKKEIQERRWMGVAQWKIPLLAKREEERLKEEQRWVGMPEWKKHLLSRRGTGQIYRDYHSIHSGNFLRRTRSAEPHNTTQSTEFDYVTRPRGISSLN